MAVIQRSLGSDTQKRVLSFSFGPNVGHGHSGPIVMIPYSARINAIQLTSYIVLTPVQDNITYFNGLV